MIKISLSGVAAALLTATLLAGSIPVYAEDEGPKTPLAEQMSGIAKDFRSLRKMVNDPARKEAMLSLVRDMENRAANAKKFKPASTRNIAPTGRDQFLADYRKHLDGLIADFQKLEEAVGAGKTADASALLDKLQGDKREGHKKFNPDSESGPQPPKSGAPNGAASPAHG